MKPSASLSTLNSSWDTHSLSFLEVTFPRVERSLEKDVYYRLIKVVPGGLKRMLSSIELDNSLKNYRFVVVLDGNWVRISTLAGLKDWASEGGILISADFLSLTAIESEIEICDELFSKTGNYKPMHCGYTLHFRGGKGCYLSFIAEAIINKDKKYPWERLTSISGTSAGQYATHFSDKVIYYDPKQFQIRVQKSKDSRESPSNLGGQPLSQKNHFS